MYHDLRKEQIPTKCNDVVYEDSDIKVVRLWKCTTNVLDDKDDDNKLYMITGKYKTYLDLDGNLLLQKPKKEYLYESDFHDGFKYALTHNKQWVLINKKHEVIPIKAEGIIEMEPAWEGMIRINTEKIYPAYPQAYETGRYGYIDQKGKVIVLPQYMNAGNFFNGRAIVWRCHYSREKSNELGFGIIDKTGKELVPCIFDEIQLICDMGLDNKVNWDDKYSAHAGGWKNGKWGIIDCKGNWFVEPIFENCVDWVRGNIIEIHTDKTVKFYDIKSKKYIFEHPNATLCFEEGWFKIKEFDKHSGREICKFVDCNGKEIFPSKYSYIGPDFSGRREVYIDGPNKKQPHKGRKYGFIDTNGKEIMPCVYEEIDANWHHKPYDIFVFSENNKWGISDFNQNVLLKPQYDMVIPWPSFGLANAYQDFAHKKEKIGVITIRGNAVLPIRYKSISLHENGYFLGRTNKKTEMFKVIMKK